MNVWCRLVRHGSQALEFHGLMEEGQEFERARRGDPAEPDVIQHDGRVKIGHVERSFIVCWPQCGGGPHPPMARIEKNT